MWNRLGYGHGADEIVFIEEHGWHGRAELSSYSPAGENPA